jgi:hypothetical protein
MDDLHLVARFDDRLSYLYVEHARIDQCDKAIALHDDSGVTPVPVASVALFLLGPGTHAAIRAPVVSPRDAYNNTVSGAAPFPAGTHAFSWYNPNLPGESGANSSTDSHGEVYFEVPGHTGMGVHTGRNLAVQNAGPQHREHGDIYEAVLVKRVGRRLGRKVFPHVVHAEYSIRRGLGRGSGLQLVG